MAAADTKTWGVPQSRSQSSFLSTGSSESSTGVDGQRRGSDQGNHSAISFCNTALSSEPDVNPLDEKEGDAIDEADVEDLQLASTSALFNGKLEPYQQPLNQQQHDTRHATPSTPREQNISPPPVNAGHKNSFERFPETIIHFPDSLPTLSLMTFEPSPVGAAATMENNDQSHEGQTTESGKRRSLRKRLSLKGLGLGLPHSRRQHNNNNLLPVDRRDQGTYRQWSRDSNLTLINGQGSTLVIREDLQEPTDSFEKTRLDATPIHSNPTAITSGVYTPSSSSRARSPIVCGMDMPKSYYSSPQKTFGGMGAGGGDDPRRYQSPSPTATTGTMSPAGKRYVDTRKRNKGDKAALKKAVTMFSNERTFNHWIKFGMLLGALAMTLLNFSITESNHRGFNQELANRAGRIGQSVGVCLMVICLLCLLYAAATYHWRHIGLVQDKSDGRYLDRIGPTLLTIGLFVTYAINVVLTIQVSSQMDDGFQPSVFYNAHHDMTAPSVTPTVAPPPILTPPAHDTPPVFDTPSLPTGSTILVDNVDEYDNDDDDDEEYADDDLEEEDYNPEAKFVPVKNSDAFNPTETDGTDPRNERSPTSPAPTVPVIGTESEDPLTDPSVEQSGTEAVS
ncbi:hypothetical protein KVV02_000140 [Mortierella alpina]|uniref:DUF202 domain-containing protein n=1 Tax=Mortierella alpina TaxID=64518 RepID=A0A9P8A6E6_MORAP|nr:hypothetical protein KVV02_000140 [Mortierella alpina]